MAKSKLDLSTFIRDAGREVIKKIEVSSNLSESSRNTSFNIIDYIDQPWGINVQLYPVQRFVLKMYYGIPLDDTPNVIEIKDPLGDKTLFRMSEREYLKFLYNEGRCNVKDQSVPKSTLVLACGRRSGKTMVSGVISSFELYKLLSLGNPQEYYGLVPGNPIQIISIATDKTQAALLYTEVASHVRNCEFFPPYIANDTQQFMNFRTPYDIERYGPIQNTDIRRGSRGKASVKVTFKPSNAKGLRGSGNLVVVLDEFAFFLEDGRNASGKDIYNSVTPSMAAFSPKDPLDKTKIIGPVESKLIIISSPGPRSGKFYEVYMDGMKGAKERGLQGSLVIQAPSWEMNPTIDPALLRQKYLEDPTVFATEFGAQFSDRVRGWLERKEYLMNCVDPERIPVTQGFPRYPYYMGIDIGLVGDGTAFFITHIEDDKIVLDYYEYWMAGVPWSETNPHLSSSAWHYTTMLETTKQIDFEEIANYIEHLCLKFNIVEGIFDSWNGIPLEQNLAKKSLKQFRSVQFGRELASMVYQTAKLLLLDKKIVLFDYIDPANVSIKLSEDGDEDVNTKDVKSPFLKEGLRLEAEQKGKNLIIVEAPDMPGLHDDLWDAFVRSVYVAYGNLDKMRGQTPKGRQVPGLSGSRFMSALDRRMLKSSRQVPERTVPKNRSRSVFPGRRY